MSPRQKEKQRLIERRDALRIKYPWGSIVEGVETPDDLLQLSREIVRFGPKHAGELYELSYEGAPGSHEPWYEPYLRGELG